MRGAFSCGCVFEEKLFTISSKQASDYVMFFILKGGTQAHFKKADCRKVLSGGQAYRCGGNFWWRDVTWLASHRVPVSNTQIA